MGSFANWMLTLTAIGTIIAAVGSVWGVRMQYLAKRRAKPVVYATVSRSRDFPQFCDIWLRVRNAEPIPCVLESVSLPRNSGYEIANYFDIKPANSPSRTIDDAEVRDNKAWSPLEARPGRTVDADELHWHLLLRSSSASKKRRAASLSISACLRWSDETKPKMMIRLQIDVTNMQTLMTT